MYEQTAFFLLCMVLLASCSVFQRHPDPVSTKDWRDALTKIQTPVSRNEFAERFPKSIPVKKGGALASFFFQTQLRSAGI